MSNCRTADKTYTLTLVNKYVTYVPLIDVKTENVNKYEDFIIIMEHNICLHIFYSPCIFWHINTARLHTTFWYHATKNHFILVIFTQVAIIPQFPILTHCQAMSTLIPRLSPIVTAFAILSSKVLIYQSILLPNNTLFLIINFYMYKTISTRHIEHIIASSNDSSTLNA